jgi:hypothetical protein
MFRNLSEHPRTWSAYEETQNVFYKHYPIDPEVGDRITESPSPAVAKAIAREFFVEGHNKEILCDVPVLRYVPRKLLQRPLNRLYKRSPLRLVEKTPANCLRIPFLAELFPDALFIFLVRRAEDVISSLMEGWKYWSGTGKGKWVYGDWHYLVPPGWQDWTTRRLEEICAFQWVESNRTAWQDLLRCCPDRFMLVRHEEALLQPVKTYEQVLQFCQLPPSRFFDRQVARAGQRVFTHGGSAPRAGKWRELHVQEVESVRCMFQPLMDQLYPEARRVETNG